MGEGPPLLRLITSGSSSPPFPRITARSVMSPVRLRVGLDDYLVVGTTDILRIHDRRHALRLLEDGPAPPTDAERALFAYADGLWPIIFELAYGIYRSEDGDWAPSRYGAVLDSVCPGDAIRALTGNDAKVVALDRPLEELRYALTRMEGGQKTAIAATVPELKKDPLEVEYTDDGLVRGHAYSILSYDPDDDMVMLRNPAGGTGGGFSESKVEKGVFWMPLIRFQGNFSRIVVEW